MKFKLGILAGIVTACILGGSGVVSKILMNMGMDSLMVIVLSHICAAPMLVILMLYKKITFKVTRREFIELLVVSLIGMAPANVTLFLAFNYIPVGQATTLHYMYPTIILLLELVFFRTKISKAKWVAIVMCMTGIFFLSPMTGSLEGQNLVLGFILALGSGLFYAIYFVTVDHTSLKYMDTVKVSLYICVLTIFEPLAFCAYRGVASFSYEPKIWIILIIFGFFVSVVATICLQLSIQYCGAVTSGIASTLEPLTALVAGVIFLQESFTAMTIIGCIFIIVAVVIIAANPKQETDEILNQE